MVSIHAAWKLLAMIHSFYIYDRHCECIYSRDYAEGTINKNNDSDTSKLLFGILYSLKNIASKLGDSESFSNSMKSFATGGMRVHMMELATGLRFILVSGLEVDNLQGVLHELYTSHYLKWVVYNGLSPVEMKSQKIGGMFISETDKYLQAVSSSM